MKVERCYEGKAIINGGMAFDGKLNWDIVLQIEDQRTEEVIIKVESDVLTLYLDNKEFCTYDYVEEYDVYLSNVDDKNELFLRVEEIDRIDFFSVRRIKELFGNKNFYVTLTVNLRKTGQEIVLVKDLRVNVLNFPNTVEDFTDFFPKDNIIYDYLDENETKVLFTMTITAFFKKMFIFHENDQKTHVITKSY